jgi:hypothetical protein
MQSLCSHSGRRSVAARWVINMTSWRGRSDADAAGWFLVVLRIEGTTWRSDQQVRVDGERRPRTISCRRNPFPQPVCFGHRVGFLVFCGKCRQWGIRVGAAKLPSEHWAVYFHRNKMYQDAGVRSCFTIELCFSDWHRPQVGRAPVR